MPRWLVLFLAVAACAGCGRREEPAFFDARTSPAPAEGRTTVAEPLPPPALQVAWKAPDAPREVAAGSPFKLSITFTNAGPVAWPDNATAHPGKKDGSYAVRLVHSWAPATGDPTVARATGLRTNLPHYVAPQETMTVPISVQAPPVAGDYRLVVELIQELVQWFADGGGTTLTLPIRVVPAAGAAPPPQR